MTKRHFVLLAVLSPIAAFAQDVIPAQAAQSSLSVLFWGTLLPIIATIVGSLVVAGLTQGVLYLRNLGKTNKLAGYAADFLEIVQHTVQHAETDIKPGLLSSLADGKGQLTPEAGAKLKGQVKDLILKQTAPEVIAAVKAKVGDGAFETYLSGAIENAVAAIPA